MALERELNTFRSSLPDLLKSHRGEFALVHETTVDSFWPTEDAALAAGYEKFLLQPFLVKEVTENEKVFYFSRDVSRCR
jgi:hypothetical protein